MDKESLLIAVNMMTRNDIIVTLESVSIQCYDHETTEELREALRQNVLDGTVTELNLSESEGE